MAASAKLMDFADDSEDRARAHRMPAFLRISQGDAAMLEAMITGDRSYLQRGVRVGFERTGSFHLLVVSGLHLAIFSGIVFWLARKVRLSRMWASVITVACSFGYALFTGFGQPVERAFWMVMLYLAGRLMWRERAGLNVIGVVALVMLAADPGALFNSGFQMTLLSVLAIAGIAAPVAEKTLAPYLRAMRNLRVLRVDPALPPKVAQFRVSVRMMAEHLQPVAGGLVAWRAFPFAIRFGLRVAELLVVSVSIELLMVLPMAAYFHRITLPALPVNLLIVPFVGVLLPAALVTFAAVLVAPSVALVPGAVTAAILHVVIWVVSFFWGRAVWGCADSCARSDGGCGVDCHGGRGDVCAADAAVRVGCGGGGACARCGAGSGSAGSGAARGRVGSDGDRCGAGGFAAGGESRGQDAAH
jgi:competence protein ComEC